jgi:beta-galactosidase
MSCKNIILDRFPSEIIRALLLSLIVPTVWLGNSLAATGDSPRLRLNADANWCFALGDTANAQDPSFNDNAWRALTLPHDWSIEGEFDAKAPMGGAGGFLPAGIGWYRRVIDMPLDWQGKRVAVEFEGVYMNTDVYLNGKKLANQPYGYTTFFVDLTPTLKPGKNVLAVRVDNSQQKNSRFYTGSGIYRHVWLHVTNPVHVAPWGVFVTTPDASRETATISVQTEVANDSDKNQSVIVQTTLLSPAGKPLQKLENPLTVSVRERGIVTQQATINQPDLWSSTTPQLSKAVTRVIVGGQVVDKTTTIYGIRSLAWSVDKGLTINGETVKLFGGCVHHDHGCLGGAAFDRAEERKVQQLLDAGFNAVRTSHAPPPPAFLDACDRLGLLVMDEAFDMWNKGKNGKDYHIYFKEWWQHDLSAMIKRDRNHPSVVMWSIGNEIPESFEPLGADTAKQLADCIRTLDKTRPVTNAIFSRPKPEQFADYDRHCAALDITGYNYTIGKHAEDHARVPDRVMVSTESNRRDTAAIYNNELSAQTYVIGDFIWTAIDYLGEAGIGRTVLDGDAGGHGNDNLYPWHGAECSDIDIVGHRRPNSHYTNIIWNRGEKLYLSVRQPVEEGHKINTGGWALYPEYASWTWPGFEEQKIKAVIYARADKVKLFQDDKLIDEKPVGAEQKFRAEFDLTYRPGTLRAEAWQDGRKIAEQTLTTAGAATALTATADRQEINANSQDFSFVTVTIVDSRGQWRPDADPELNFTISGPGVLQGIATADMKSTEPYQGVTKRKAFEGRALAVIRSIGQAGKIKLTVSADGLPPANVTLEANSVKQENYLP